MQSEPGRNTFVDVSSDLLTRGYGVRFTATGASMSPAICDGDVISVEPVAASKLSPGSVAVYRRSDRLFAHRLVRVDADSRGCEQLLLRGDASATCDAPVAPSQVLGQVVSVTPRPYGRMYRRVRRAAASVMLAFFTLALMCAVPAVAEAAVVQQVQSGTAVNNANGVQTITISAVDTSKSFLIFQARSSGDRPVNSLLRGRLASATTIQFERVTNEGAPLAINIQWYVATFGSGVTVQRGESTLSATTVNVPITAVSSMNQAFVLWSMTSADTANEHGNDDTIAGDLTTTTNLQFRTTGVANHIVSWQVVQFTNAADINVQRGSVTTMTGATVSTTATLPVAVDVSRTFVLAAVRTDGGGPDMGSRVVRAQLTNSTTITFDRGSAGSPDNMTEISWQAVELRDGSTVQRGSASFAAGAAQTTATLVTRVNTTRAIAFASGQNSGQSMGRTPYIANDVLGVATATAALSPTQLTLDRNSTLAAADIGWFVVQFAGGNGFKVGSFTKTPGAAPASQAIAHGLGEVPKALILWTQGRSDETFSSASGITFKGAATGSAVSGVLTLSVVVPAATAANDVMIASIAVRPETAVITAPAGWTLVRRTNNPGPTAGSLAVYRKVATASEPANYSWTFNTSTGSAGGIQSFSGVDVTNPVDVENGAATASSLTHLAPSVTTTVANDMVVTTHAMMSSATWTPPAGMTEAFDVMSDAAPNALGMTVVGSYAVQAAAGATGTKSAVASNDADVANTHTLTLRAAPAGTAYFGYGMTDGTASRSVSTSSQDGVANSNASTRMASKVLTIVRWGEVAVAEADLSSWNDTNFTLNWTTNDANSYVIHYIAIGGSDVSAKVVDWTMRTAVGNQAVTGVGFQPDVVFHAHGGHAFTGALGTNLAGGAFGLGVMDFDGEQWAFANWTADNSANSNTQRGQLTDAALLSFNNTPTIQKRASWVSMNADGFTMNFITASGAAARVFSLALKGVNVKPGSFTKAVTAAPAPQPITGVGFRPGLVMLASVQNTTSATPVAHSRFGLGASDGTTEGSTAFQDTDALATISVDAISKTSKVFMKVDNNTPAINAEADLTAMGADGFSLNWTTNDAVATEILYLSLAPLAVTEVRLISFTASRESQGVHLAWRTGYEVSNLGFHLYREIGGRRTRVTRSLVAGSGLTVGARNRVASEQNYSYWDRDAAAQSPQAVYWLQDVDFNGTSTWHGPITPGAALARPGAPVAGDSPLLAGLGRGVGHREERFSASPESEPRINEAEPLVRRQMSMSMSASAPISIQAAATAEQARQTQWAIAGQPAVKMGVRVSGWYRVNQPALAAAGLPGSVDPAMLRLYLDGVEQPMKVTGAGDGQFDPADAIEFYGTGVDTPYADTAVYWLTWGTGTGLRVQDAPPAGPGPAGAPRFWGTVERKDRSVYFAALRNGSAENWFGELISPDAPVDVIVNVRRPDASAPSAATLEVTLQGVTLTSDPVGHQVAVRLNGAPVGTVTFEGRNLGSATLTVAHNLILDGANVVQLEALGGEADMSLFDTVRLSYWHTNEADDNQLELTADAQRTVTIGAFTSSPIRVVDITDTEAQIELPTTPGSPGSVDVQTPGAGTRTLFAFAAAAIKTPVFVAANQPSSLNAVTNQHNYLIVSHPDFVNQMAPLAAHRASQGYQARLVSIEDVYDEFGFGVRSPGALRDFLTQARSWAVPPRYVLLAGDATFDPRDYGAFGFGDFVPTALVDMAEIELETASDDWFVDGNGDGVPDIAIGRLPVRTAGQASTIVGKIAAYDADPGGSWARNITLVTDTDDPTVKFRASSDGVATRVPASFTTHKLYRDDIGVGPLRTALFSRVTEGQLIVNYLGHGSSYIWGKTGELLSRADIGTNWTTTGSRLPFVVAMNCLNGFFQSTEDEESLAETLLRANGGAVAVWASSSLTEAEPQGVMNDELFRLLFTPGAQGTLGDAVAAAKSGVLSSDVRRSWIFFGDPAMRLKGLPVAPPPAPPTLAVAPAALNFGVVSSGGTLTTSTPAQTVRVTQTGTGTVTWTASANQPWIQITNGTGTGTGRFTINVIQTGLPASGTATGTVALTVNGSSSAPTVSVRVSIIPAGTSNPPFGTIDTPLQGATGISGAIAVTGWALDDVAVTRLQIFRDAVTARGRGSRVRERRVVHPGRSSGRRDGVSAASAELSRRVGRHGPDEHAAQPGERHLHGPRGRDRSRRALRAARLADVHVGQRELAETVRIDRYAGPHPGCVGPRVPELRVGAHAATQDDPVQRIDHLRHRRRRRRRSSGCARRALGHPGALPGLQQHEQRRRRLRAQHDGLRGWPAHHLLGRDRRCRRDQGNREPLLHRSTTAAAGRWCSPSSRPRPPSRTGVRRLNPADRILVRQGDDEAAPFEAVPFSGRTRQIAGHELERIEIKLAADHGRITGFAISGLSHRRRGEASVADRLHARRRDRSLLWQPGAGFIGAYRSAVRPHHAGWTLGADCRPDRAAAAPSQRVGRADGDRHAGAWRHSLDVHRGGLGDRPRCAVGSRHRRRSRLGVPESRIRRGTDLPRRGAPAPARPDVGAYYGERSRTLSTSSSSRGSRQGSTTSSSSRTAPSPRSSSLPQWCA